MSTIKRAELYPPATSVKVYAMPTPRPGELSKRTGDPATWLPAPTLLGTYEVTAGGLLEPALAAGQPYLCWAQVGGKDVYLHARLRGSEPELV